jgi:serine phosphatase RsbU (regulator of sigma subunit)
MAVKLGGFVSEVRATLAVLLLIVPLLAYGGWDLQRRVTETAYYQAQIRQAQILRSALLRAQIDEETGIRGYTETGNRVFLEPYDKAVAAFPRRAEALRTIFQNLKRQNDLDVLDEETNLNLLWQLQVARPILVHRGVGNQALQLAGKAMVDNFRERDAQQTRELSTAAIEADASLQRAISGAITFMIAVLTLISIAGLIGAYYVSRSARRAFESRVLYQNQKRIAESLQTAFLQKTLPMTPGIGLHAMYVPATSEAQVGGDWYDAFTLPDGRLLFSIGDVAGHGIDAAIVMSRARQAIVAAALQEDDPARVLSRANDAIILQDSRMVTAICGFIDPATLEMSYATAGHPPPVLAGPHQAATFMEHEGIPLGIMRGIVYRTFFTTATRDALIAFYTDGVIEHKRDIFEGERRLLSAVDAAVGREDPAVAIHEQIFDSATPADDVAIFTVTFRAVEGEPVPEATIDALQASRMNVGSRAMGLQFATCGNANRSPWAPFFADGKRAFPLSAPDRA